VTQIVTVVVQYQLSNSVLTVSLLNVTQALHYKELDFQTAPAACVESLIAINKKLGQPEAALGVLTYAQRRLGSVIAVKESWLAKLGHWEQALDLYTAKVLQ
jgi:serine/threonine-protein kinase mTOR